MQRKRTWFGAAFLLVTALIVSLLMVGCSSGGAQKSAKWNLVGKWAIRADTSSKTMDTMIFSIESQSGSKFSGSSGNTSGSQTDSRQRTFAGTIGSNADGPVSMHVVYVGTKYFMDLTGTIDSAGHLSGTWKDSGSITGTFTSLTGAATPIQ
jgi:hypothetical protein